MAGLIGGLISEAEIVAAQMNSPVVQAHVIEIANKARDEIEALAPVGSVEHTLKSGYVDHPGDYKRAVQVIFSRKDGIPQARVQDADYKRAWVEYGSIHNDEHAIFTKVAAKYGAKPDIATD
jgi:hypothetical protein